MKLYEYESKIRDQIENDINNPELFLDIQRVTGYFLRRKKACHCARDYTEIACHIAEDVYMDLLDGKRFDHLYGYLNRIYRTYVIQYYKDYGPDVISFDENIKLKDIVQDPAAYMNNYLNNRIYLLEIGNVVEQTMLDSCKYVSDSKAYLNLKVSLLLTTLRGDTSYFHLDEAQSFYLNIIKVNFYNQIRKESLGVETVL